MRLYVLLQFLQVKHGASRRPRAGLDMRDGADGMLNKRRILLNLLHQHFKLPNRLRGARKAMISRCLKESTWVSFGLVLMHRVMFGTA